MGILKTVAKVAGTAVLTTTGVASTILKGFSDTAGIELGSEIFNATKEASFNGIRAMWDDSDSCEKNLEKVEGMEDATRRKMANTAWDAAQAAKKAGNDELYEKYMEKYDEYK